MRQPVRHRVVGRDQARAFAHAGDHRFEHRMRRVEHRLLRHVGNARRRRHPDLAIVERGLSRDRLEQRGLAGAVAADQRHPFLGVELEIGVVEQGNVAKGEAGTGDGNERHEEKPISRSRK